MSLPLAIRMLSVATLLLIAGCQTSALPPPVSVSYRDSLIGAGKVLQITNDSSHHLYNVKVTIPSLKSGNSASVKATDHLRPGATVEVGWLEFESRVVEPGEVIQIHCDDYVTPYVTKVPDYVTE